jgi:PIN domain nuclease of toxin-antitoxin system
VIVLDSSAMVAYLNGQDGGDVVRDVLADPDRDVPVYAHAVNLCEVFHLFLRAGGPSIAEAAIAELKGAGVEERADMDGAFWRDAAALIATQRGQGLQLAQGDAFGLALARRESADFYTADRHELTSVAAVGLASIVFIR